MGASISNIIERALTHIFMDLGLIVGLFAVLESLKSRLRAVLPTLQSRLLAACLLIAIIVAGREAYDLHAGQAYAKVWTDYASHVVGLSGGWIASRWLIKKQWR